MSAAVASGMSDGGLPCYCSLCACWVWVEPSDPPGDAPCPSCGCLLWIAPESARPVATSWPRNRPGLAATLRRAARPLLWCYVILRALLRVSRSYLTSRMSVDRLRVITSPRRETPRSGVWDPWLDA